MVEPTIIVVPTGSSNEADKVDMAKLGFFVIEVDDPSVVRMLTARHKEQNALLAAALKAINAHRESQILFAKLADEYLSQPHKATD